MLILYSFAFLAGIVTILSPCILPILPVILSSSIPGSASRLRPYGIVTGFILSFTFFTLFLSTLVKLFGIPVDALRTLSVVIIAGFGLSLLIPPVQLFIEQLFSRLANRVPSTTGKTGFGGGVLIGLSLGLLWTPCVGPILASVISLAITGTVTTDAFFITLAYSIGTAIPMLMIILGGQKLLTKTPWLLRNTRKIQKAFGVIMILTAIGIYNGVDRTFQTYILTTFPNYGVGLTKFEDKELVKDQLVDLSKTSEPGSKNSDVAPELILGGEWFNSKPLALSQLKGKVVLVDFWTYTCINCQRTFPYLKDWDKKYRESGLTIIGVHSPEFEFEKSAANVQQALKDFGITYPVMQDNDFATWRAYSNRYWPAKYLVDGTGKIRYTHFGEGDYDETEVMIQTLLKETGASPSAAINNPTYRTYARSPELYLGSARYAPSTPITYSGKWSKSVEYALPSAGASLTLSFDAKDVYLVMRPVDTSTKVEVYLDDKYVKNITVEANTLYTLVEMDNPGQHELKLVFPDGNIELFAFTFG